MLFSVSGMELTLLKYFSLTLNAKPSAIVSGSLGTSLLSSICLLVTFSSGLETLKYGDDPSTRTCAFFGSTCLAHAHMFLLGCGQMKRVSHSNASCMVLAVKSL